MNRVALLLAITMLTPGLTGCIGGSSDDGGTPLTLDPCKDEPTGTPAPGGSPDASTTDHAVGYATDDDRTLLRWYWGQDLPETASFVIYRTPEDGKGQPVATLPAGLDRRDAADVLDNADPRWTNLSEILVDRLSVAPFNATSFDDVLDLFEESPSLASLLAMRYPPISLVTGQGYLDTEGQDGTTYTYEVILRKPGSTTQRVGEVTVETGQVTPLPAPEGLTCIELGPGAELRQSQAGDWRSDPADRRFDQKVLLRWDPVPMTGAQASGPWIAGYDVFRTPYPDDVPSSLADLGLEQLNGETPIQPMPSYVPVNGSATTTEFIDLHFADETPEPGDWIYTVAARDLLGNPVEPSDQIAALSDPVIATAYDIDPPAPPRNVTADPNGANDAVVVAWDHINMTPAQQVSFEGSGANGRFGGSQGMSATMPAQIHASSELDHFKVYRTTNHSAASPSQCSVANQSLCWELVADNVTGANWVDQDAETGQVYWYRVAAVDHDDMPSTHGGPVRGTLVDQTPPPAPSVVLVGKYFEEAHQPTDHELTITAAPGETPARYRIDCRFSQDGAWIRIAEVPYDGTSTDVRLEQHYLPPVPTDGAACSARALDAQGNPSERSNDASVTGYGDRQPLPQPILSHVGMDEPPQPTTYGDQLSGSGALDAVTVDTDDIHLPEGSVSLPPGQSGASNGSGDQAGIGPGQMPTDTSSLPGGSQQAGESIQNPYAGTIQVDAEADPVSVHLTWAMPPLPTIAKVEVHRFDMDNRSQRVIDVPVGTTGIEDTTVVDGHAYMYNVSVEADWGQRVWSQPREIQVQATQDAADLDRGQRPLGDLDWAGLSHAQAHVGTPSETTLQWLCDLCGDAPGHFAIFRSHQADEGYVQITPIQPVEKTGKPGDPTLTYTVLNETRSDAWYVVVAFDPRTGEPVARTEAAQPRVLPVLQEETPIAEIGWDTSPLAQGISVWNEPCRGDPLVQGVPIRLSGGYTMTVDTWANQDPHHLSGTGRVTLQTSDGPREAVASFDGLQVNQTLGPNAVCHGRVQVDPGVSPANNLQVQMPGDDQDAAGQTDDPSGVPIDGPAGMTFRMVDLLLGPVTAPAVANLTLELPGGMAFDQGRNVTSDQLPLRNVLVDAGGSIQFQTDLAGAGQTCQAPLFSLPLDTLPMRLVPLGEISVGQAGLSMEDACLRYEDPYRLDLDDPTHDGLEPRPQADLTRGDANDGFLRTTFHATGPVSLDGQGLDGSFESDLPQGTLDYMASAPFGFQVQIDDRVEIDLDDTRIASGTVHDAEVSFWHHSLAGNHPLETLGVTHRSPTLHLSFPAMDILPGGALHGTAAATHPVTWAKHHTLDPTGWELLIGNVTTGGTPAETITAAHPAKPEQVTPFGTTYPEPGLNLRTENATLAWDCAGGIDMDAATDVYVRHGGLSDVIRADLPADGSAIDLHGYDAVLSLWGRSFLDNRGLHDDLAGAVDLPFPANVTLPLDPMHLGRDGCIAGGSSATDLVLDYWELPTSLDAVEFRPVPAGVDHDGDKVLWTLGSHEVPHLTLPDQAAGSVHAEMAFLPDGSFAKARVLHDRAHYEADGHTLLLEHLALSQVGQDAHWDQAATLQTPPDANATGYWDDQGFIDIGGRLVTPYFGPLTSPGGTAPNLRVVAGEDYLGFDRQPRAEKVWVDIADAQLVWGFDLLYAQNLTGEQPGTFTAYDSYEFLPVGLLMDTLEMPVRAAEHGLMEAEDSVRDRLQDGRQLVDDAFQQAHQLRIGARTSTQQTLNDTLDQGQAQVETAIQDVFDQARTSIETLDDGSSTEQELTGVRGDLATTIQDARGITDTIEDALGSIRNAKQTALDPLAAELITARDGLEDLQHTTRNTRRMTADMETRLEGLRDALATANALPIPLDDTIDMSELSPEAQALANQAAGSMAADLANGTASLQAVEDTLQVVHDVRIELDQALAEAEDAIAAIDDAVAEVQHAVQRLDQAADTLIMIGENLVQPVVEALDEADAAIAAADPGQIDQVFLAPMLDELNASETQALATTAMLFDNVRAGADAVFQDLDAALASAVASAKTVVDGLMDDLETEVLDLMAQIRAQVMVYAGYLLAEAEAFLLDARILYLDAAPVIGTDELGTYLGLASGPGALLALASATGLTGQSWGPQLQSQAQGWAQRLELPSTYVDVFEGAWTDQGLATQQGAQAVAGAVDAWVDADPERTLLQNDTIGGGTGGLLADYGADLDQLRGHVAVSEVGQDDWQFDSLSLALRADLGTDPEAPLFKADTVGMAIDRHGMFALKAHGIETELMGQAPEVDVDVLIVVAEPRLEGALTLYDLSLQNIDILQAGAAMGLGAEIAYIGASFDAVLSTGSSTIGMGGAILVGRIDTGSPVLEHHYPQVIERVKDLPSGTTGGSGIVTGLYMRAHGDLPVEQLLGIQAGCMLSVNVGARVGMWFFAADGDQGGLTFGGQLGGYVTGEVVCAVSARGEILMEYRYIDPGDGSDPYHLMEGDAWMAGGIGDCEPGTWKKWEKRWWGDSWCGQAGAYFTLSYTTKTDTWTWDHSIDSEL